MKMKLQKGKNKNRLKVLCFAGGIFLVLAILTTVILLWPQPLETVDPRGVVKISLSAVPHKTTYYVGEEFDPAGVSVQVITNDMEHTSFVGHEDLSFSGFDSSVPAENQVITATYKGFTATFTVTVKENPSETPTLVSIRMGDSFKTTYTLSSWNNFGPKTNNATIVCTYSDGSEVEIPMKGQYCDNVLDVDSPGTTQFTVRYTDEYGTTVETTVTVTITE